MSTLLDVWRRVLFERNNYVNDGRCVSANNEENPHLQWGRQLSGQTNTRVLRRLQVKDKNSALCTNQQIGNKSINTFLYNIL